jgi:cell wall-associated NlpC family hydrolase
MPVVSTRPDPALSTPAPTTKRTNRRFAALLTATVTAAMSAALAIPAATATATISPAGAATAAHHGHGSGHGQGHRGQGHSHHAAMSESQRFAEKASKVISEARKQRGKPYVYGASGPGSFDCSGLVRYVFMNALHKNLPHNAAEQYSASQHISRNQLRVGDLAFVDDGGYVSHVGIYDGHGFWWVAPHSGTRVQRQRMYSAHYVFGRVIHWPSKH